MTQEMNDDVFFEKYTCEYNQVKQKELAEQEDNGVTTIADMAPYEGRMYETYGEEYDRVKEVLNDNPKRIWTLIDNNDGWTGIVAGWHWVNCMGYFITEEDWERDSEEYTCYDTTELREQWDSLPKEAIMSVCGIEYIGDDPDELQLYKDENFYEWEQMSEEQRDDILKQYKTTT